MLSSACPVSLSKLTNHIKPLFHLGEEGVTGWREIRGVQLREFPPHRRKHQEWGRKVPSNCVILLGEFLTRTLNSGRSLVFEVNDLLDWF